ncbi:pyruvate, water dikinase regulatory protein [uncultured Gemella sp.]|uniref:pyruvate, water dikinase regulatory protein n=1 Tax=uncultured Gemella sp. TaxID=254352 RepID=UPI0025DC709C|nr:pyruvate, water dikinase regulatory protein [uncultured Gemella sp.]
MLTVHIISDSIGNTAKDVVDAALVQFSYENKQYKVLKNSNVCTKEKVDCIISNVNDGDVIVQTLVDGALARYVKEKGLEKNIKVIDLLSEMLSTFEEKLGVKAEGNPGLNRKMGAEYFKRIDALEFAVKYDDGKDINGLKEADVIILGVSRTSKTPLSLYLANRNIKVMNVPIIQDLILPEQLYEVKRKVIGLTNSVEQLNKLREERLKTLGVVGNSDYTDEIQIFEELEYALEIMGKLGCPIIDVQNKAVEETAELIIGIMRERGQEV